MLSVLVLAWLYATAVAAVLFGALVLVQSVARGREHLGRLLHERRHRGGRRQPLGARTGRA